MKRELDLLGLPDVPHKVLNNTPLVLALCQVRFSSMLSVADTASRSGFQRAIQSNYPVALQVQEGEVLVGFGENEIGLRGEQRRSPLWQFSDLNDIWKIVLSQDFLSLETRKYVHFDDFLERLQEALDALIEHIQPTVGTRVGLRYINEIRSSSLNELSWFDVIRQDLLGPIAVPELMHNTSQVISVQQLLLRYPDDVGINIHYGLLPGSTTLRLRPKGESPTDACYLLDFDVFREFSLPQALAMDARAICQNVALYHEMIYRLFRWSVSEKYISRMEK